MSSPSSEFHAVSHGQSLQQAHNNLNPGNPGRFPNPGNLQADSTGSSYNGFVGGGLPFPRCNTSALRRSRHFVPNECKDEYYWHKRLKNNEAARKSRQKRRNIDSVLEEKVLVLSHENDMLRNELYSLKVRFSISSPHTHHLTGSSSCIHINNDIKMFVW
jgi:leukemia factor-related protein